MMPVFGKSLWKKRCKPWQTNDLGLRLNFPRIIGYGWVYKLKKMMEILSDTKLG